MTESTTKVNTLYIVSFWVSINIYETEMAERYRRKTWLTTCIRGV